MRTQLNAYILFCEYYNLVPFPVSKRSFLAYLIFLSFAFIIILSFEAVKTLVQALVIGRLDYCNSVLYDSLWQRANARNVSFESL